MKAPRLLATLPVLAAFAIAAAPAAAQTDTQAALSQNWAGYTAGGTGSGTSFSSVSGSWVQPAAKCGSGSTYSAFWVGLGGSSQQSSSLEQVGTQADCSASGQTKYYAWYELVPAAPVQLNMTIKPGDHMSGRVTVNGNSVTLSITDATTGASTTKTLTMQNPDTSSAEWIAEAPSVCDVSGNCQPLSLADFGTVSFTNATATANGHTGPISDSAWAAQPVDLTPGALGGLGSGLPSGGPQFAGTSASTAGATPSSLSADGSSFSVAYQANATSSSTATATSGSGAGSGYGGYGAGSGYGGYGGGGYGGSGYGGYGYSPYGYGVYVVPGYGAGSYGLAYSY